MPRTKQIEKYQLATEGLLPEDQPIVEASRRVMNGIASFYGFEIASLPSLVSAIALAPIIKAGFGESYHMVSIEVRNGGEWFLHPPLALAAIHFASQPRFANHPGPLKFLVEGLVGAGHDVKEGASDAKKDGQETLMRLEREWTWAVIGEEGSVGEAEVIHVTTKMLAELGIPPDAMELRINATGCPECRVSFSSSLGGYFRSRSARLCKNSKRDLKKYPTKILRCEDERCAALAQGAPQILDHVCDNCRKHLRGILEFLDEINVAYFLDHKLFREGYAYSRIVFELSRATAETSPQPTESSPAPTVEGESVAPPTPAPLSPKPTPKKLRLAEGGRLIRAAELIAGRKVEAVVMNISFGNLRRALEAHPAPATEGELPKVFLMQLGDLAKRKSLTLMETLRASGIVAAEMLGRDSIKSQLNLAERHGVRIALILGQKESIDNTIIVRDMESGSQETIHRGKLLDFLKRKFSKENNGL